jgi:predicted dehydrogenase
LAFPEFEYLYRLLKEGQQIQRVEMERYVSWKDVTGENGVSGKTGIAGGTGYVFDLAAHDIDLALQVMTPDTIQVYNADFCYGKLQTANIVLRTSARPDFELHMGVGASKHHSAFHHSWSAEIGSETHWYDGDRVRWTEKSDDSEPAQLVEFPSRTVPEIFAYEQKIAIDYMTGATSHPGFLCPKAAANTVDAFQLIQSLAQQSDTRETRLVLAY